MLRTLTFYIFCSTSQVSGQLKTLMNTDKFPLEVQVTVDLVFEVPSCLESSFTIFNCNTVERLSMTDVEANY